ncbi:hypothetical protein Bca101_059060 [Brassica carinata]
MALEFLRGGEGRGQAESALRVWLRRISILLCRSVRAIGLEACGGAGCLSPCARRDVVSKKALRCGEEYRASLSFQLGVLLIG